jgi:hypothetical protein
MAEVVSDPSAVLTLSGVAAVCADCGDERIFVPTSPDLGEYCCTSCDAAVFLLAAVGPGRSDSSRVA